MSTTLALIAALSLAGTPVQLNQLSWLAGHWRLVNGDRVVEEHWLAPDGGLMLGVSRTVRSGKATAHEFLLLRQEGEGLVLVAHPSGQKETTFKLTSLTGTIAVFENPAHDFPKKIIYERKADGSLLAAIEGPGPGGKVRRIEFPYLRAP